MDDVASLLAASSARHSHLCPRQVLGVRMALAGIAALGLDGPPGAKGLLVIAETDGCFVDGLEVAASVSPGHRTLRIEDYGKVAATFVDVERGEALRLWPRPGARERSYEYAPGETRRYFAQLAGYQVMPDSELFSAVPVALVPGIEAIVSRPGVRACCAACGEEIINEREIVVDGAPYCRSCAGGAYYRMSLGPAPMFTRLEQAASR